MKNTIESIFLLIKKARKGLAKISFVNDLFGDEDDACEFSYNGTKGIVTVFFDKEHSDSYKVDLFFPNPSDKWKKAIVSSREKLLKKYVFFIKTE